MTGLSGHIGGWAGFGGAALLVFAAVAISQPARSQTDARIGQPGVGETVPFGPGATVPSGGRLLRPGVDAQIPTSSSQSGVLQFPVPPVAPVIDLRRGTPQRSAPVTPPVVGGQPLPPPGQQTLRQWIDSFNQSAMPATPPARTAPVRPPAQTQPVISTAKPAPEPVFAPPPARTQPTPPPAAVAPARSAPAAEPTPPPAATAPASPPAQTTLANPQPRLTPPTAEQPEAPAAAQEPLSPPPPPTATPPARQAAAPAAVPPAPETTAPAAAPQEAKPTAPAEPAPAAAAPQRAAAPASGVDLRIVFPANAIDLPDSFKPQLEELAARMQAEPELRIEMRGYAMAREGGISRARRSSLQRALATRSFLLERQVKSTRIDVRALGDRTPEEPVDRVDIIIKSE